MGMKRYYGVIRESSDAGSGAMQFINDLNMAVRNQDGTAFNGYLGTLSGYTTEASDAEKAEIEYRRNKGDINESLNPESQKIVLAELTKTASESKDTDAVITIVDKCLFLIVRPYNVSEGTPVARIIIKHISGEFGTTNIHTTEFDLGNPNSNGWAPSIAYEITSTYSGDTLVKLAWCDAYSVSGTRDELEGVMAAQSIGCYRALIVDGDTPGTRKIELRHSGASHDEYVYNAKGPIGGFLVHQLSGSSNRYGQAPWAITVFADDMTPIYTWSAESRPYDEYGKNTGKKNVNLPSLGRKIAPPDENGDTPVKMTVLAPIMTPAVDEPAKWAKWMQQGIHDYSYFDDSGHIHLLGGNNTAQTDSAWFVDHGICLYDGAVSKFVKSGRATPNWTGSDLVNVRRPVLDNKISYADDFTIYLDSEAGLSDSKWMSVNDDSDMTFTGGPDIGVDSLTGRKFVRFTNSDLVYSRGDVPFRMDLDHDKNGVDYSSGGKELRTVMLVAGRLNITSLAGSYTAEGRTEGVYWPFFAVTNHKAFLSPWDHTEFYCPVLLLTSGQNSTYLLHKTRFATKGPQYSMMYIDGLTNSSLSQIVAPRFVMAMYGIRSTNSQWRYFIRYEDENGITIRETPFNTSTGASVLFDGMMSFNGLTFSQTAPPDDYVERQYRYLPSAWRQHSSLPATTVGRYIPHNEWSCITGGTPNYSMDIYFAAAGNAIEADHVTVQFNDLKQRFFSNT